MIPWVFNFCGIFLWHSIVLQTVSAFHSFFLAMVLYPDVARKAQGELDAVIGQDRLPEMSDRPFLPYIGAIVLEVLRWIPLTPLGM